MPHGIAGARVAKGHRRDRDRRLRWPCDAATG